MKKYDINFNESLNKTKDITKDDDLREAVLHEYDAIQDLNKKVGSLNENKPLRDVPEYNKNEFLTENKNI